MLQSGSIFSSVMTKPMNNIFNYPRLLRQKCPIESLMKRRTTVNIRDAHSIVLMWSMLFMHRERGKRLKGTLSRDFWPLFCLKDSTWITYEQAKTRTFSFTRRYLRKTYADTSMTMRTLFENFDGFSQILKEQSGEKRYLNVFTNPVAII